ncbi:MAG: hypothetical protein IKE94_01230 [Aeriscardovia sp.]|nr:hypothetical protein [Aeriscardovia sp.]
MSEKIIEYRSEFNVMDFVNKYAERVNHVIDEQTLANLECRLAEYGYVKVVRCRDCAYICNREYANGYVYYTCSYFDSEHAEIEPNGFCKWGVGR